MKKLVIIILLCSSIFSEVFAIVRVQQKAPKMNVATFNIRLQTPADTAARSWDNRKTDVARLIKQYNFDIFGVQEVGNQKQEADLKALIPGFTYFGKGRDNQEGTEGEQIGIFFKTNRFKAEENGFFFLSDTPEKMSLGWDAAYRRICVWIKFYDQQSKTNFYYFCTHFDHIGIKARAESAKLIVKRIKVIAKDAPVILAGDLNASTNEPEMYKTLINFLNDSRDISLIKPKSPEGTFNGYEINTDSIPTFNRIDYLFCRKFQVVNYLVIRERYSKYTYPSDHFPVMIECEIMKQ